MSKPLIIVGGGAAGFFAAVNAARLNPARAVVIAEKTGKLLAKVRASGGGRCNVTHACFSVGEMAERYPRGWHFVRKTFGHFFTTDTIAWFDARGVKLKTEADGRMFPVTDSSETIAGCLEAEARELGVRVLLNHDVRAIEREGDGFLVRFSNGNSLEADACCVACGGYPKSAMFDWLRATGHAIETPVPSLFTFNLPGDPITALPGIAVPDASVRVAGTKLSERGAVLITHWGLSGPAVLRTSAWGARELAARDYRFTGQVGWLPEFNSESMHARMQALRREAATQRVSGRNGFGLPQRLWEFLVQAAGIPPELRFADLPAAGQRRLAESLVRQTFEISGKTTFKEEFVTAGGVALGQVDPHTMQSRLVPGLHFAGEVLDVDGVTGGFNFQHAWTSGFLAGRSLAAIS